jgi:hypothetical protein
LKDRFCLTTYNLLPFNYLVCKAFRGISLVYLEDTLRLVSMTILPRKERRDIRVIRKVRITQHQNPEFGHTKGEFKKIYKKVL